MTGLKQWRGRRLHTYELVARAALMVFAYALPIVFYSDVQHYLEIGRNLGWHSYPYRDFTWEFPPLAIFALILSPLTAYNSFAYHAIFVSIMVLCEWTCLCRLRQLDEKHFWPITTYWSAVVVPLSLLAWNRLDYLSVLFVTLGIVAILQGKPVVRWIALGFVAKLWPVLLCVALFARRQFKDLASAIGVVAALAGAWFLFSPDGFREFLEFRKGAGFQIESLPGAVLHFFGREYFFEFGTVSVSDDGWKWLQTVMFFSTIVSVAALAIVGFRQKQRDDVMLVGACVALTLILSRIISTQFLVWLAPFIVLRVTQYRPIAVLYALSIAVSFVLLCFYEQFTDHTGTFLSFLQIVRNVLLTALAIAMTYAAVFPKVITSGIGMTRESEGALAAKEAGAESGAM